MKLVVSDMTDIVVKGQIELESNRIYSPWYRQAQPQTECALLYTIFTLPIKLNTDDDSVLS
jgi:hypothetical protein